MSAEELAEAVLAWLGDSGVRKRAGLAALQLVESGRGSLALSLQAVYKILDRT